MKRATLTLLIALAAQISLAKEPNFIIIYAAMVEEMDMTASGIVDALEAKGEPDNTYCASKLGAQEYVRANWIRHTGEE